MNRRFALAIILTAFLLFSFAPPVSALYKWVDEKGHLHITDNPPPTRQQREEPEAPRTPAAPVPAPEKTPVPPLTVPQAVQPSAQSRPSQTAPASAPGIAAAPPQTSPSRTAQQAIPVPAPAAQPAPAPPVPAVKEESRGNVPSPFSQRNAPPGNVMTALMAGFMTVFLFIAVGAYVFFSLCMYLIAKKLNVAEAWAAWIPILQVWPFLTSAGKPCWWVILLFIPLVNIFIGTYLWMCIAENLGRNKWLGLLMLLPVVNFVFMGVLAFTQEEAAQPVRAV